MFKLLVLSCLLVSCLAEPPGHASWLREAGRGGRHPRGCADRAAGWRACALVNNTDSLAPHARDCSVFFYCSSAGAPPVCRKCPGGLRFNPQLQVCDWPENVDCKPHPPRPFPSHNSTTPLPATVTDDSTTTDAVTTNAPLTDSTTTEAATTEAATTEAATTEAATTEAATTEPATTESATTEAATTEPATTEPATTEAATTEAATTEAATTEAATTEV